MLILYRISLITSDCLKNLIELFPNLKYQEKIKVSIKEDDYVMAIYKNKSIGYFNSTDSDKYKYYLKDNNLKEVSECDAKVEKTECGYLVYLALEI